MSAYVGTKDEFILTEFKDEEYHKVKERHYVAPLEVTSFEQAVRRRANWLFEHISVA
jgi:hypothetical protein